MTFPVYTADKLLDELHITQQDLLTHLDEIAYARGALVVDGDLHGSEARLNMCGKPAIITVSRIVTHSTRKRFNVAHELGHLELHRYKMTLCTSDDMMEWSVKEGSKNFELEANEFAAAFLMPERFFASHCEVAPSFDYFRHLANQFRVSLTAASIRYSNFTPEPVAIVFSQDGYIKWFRASKEFEEMELFVNVRSRVFAGSLAAQLFAGKPMPATTKRVSADAWLRPGSYDPGAFIQENSWSIDSANAVMTLLWVDEDIYESDDC